MTIDREEVFNELLKKHKKLFMKVAWVFAKSKHDVEDILQEAYIDIWKGMDETRPMKSIKSWARTIVYRKAIKYSKKRLTINTGYVNIDIEDERDIYTDIEVSLLKDKIPNLYMDALSAVYEKGMSYKKSAAFLEIKEETLKKRIYRGKKLIRMLMEE